MRVLLHRLGVSGVWGCVGFMVGKVGGNAMTPKQPIGVAYSAYTITKGGEK
jgi:hypothetical protein